jgi:hypothetical protein
MVGVGKDSRLPDRNNFKKMKYLNLVLKEGISRSLSSATDEPPSKITNP